MDAKLEVLSGITLPEYNTPAEMLDRIGEFLKTGSAKCGERFKDPEDDWAPMYLVVFDKGSCGAYYRRRR